jgi:large subunit ribosomal protein L30
MSTQSVSSAPAEVGGSDAHLLVVVRTKGSANLPSDVRRTLAQLRLLRVFSACLVPSSPDYLGMLRTAKDVVCWGEIERGLLERLLAKRGRLVGNRRLTEENLRRFSGLGSVRELADTIYSRKLQLRDVKGMKPFFRLSPPKGGFKGSKKKGYSGYLGREINELVTRML